MRRLHFSALCYNIKLQKAGSASPDSCCYVVVTKDVQTLGKMQAGGVEQRESGGGANLRADGWICMENTLKHSCGKPYWQDDPLTQ